MSSHYKLIATLHSRSALPGCLAFSPNGKVLASYSPGRPLLLTRCRDGKGVIDVKITEEIQVLAWNPVERQELICGFENGVFAILRLTDEQVRIMAETQHFCPPRLYRIILHKTLSKPTPALSATLPSVA